MDQSKSHCASKSTWKSVLMSCPTPHYRITQLSNWKVASVLCPWGGKAWSKRKVGDGASHHCIPFWDQKRALKTSQQISFHGRRSHESQQKCEMWHRETWKGFHSGVPHLIEPSKNDVAALRRSRWCSNAIAFDGDHPVNEKRCSSSLPYSSSPRQSQNAIHSVDQVIPTIDFRPLSPSKKESFGYKLWASYETDSFRPVKKFSPNIRVG